MNYQKIKQLVLKTKLFLTNGKVPIDDKVLLEIISTVIVLSDKKRLLICIDDICEANYKLKKDEKGLLMKMLIKRYW